MAETSIFWSTGSTGDGASPYTQSQLFQWLRRTHVSDNYASEGPLRGYNSELAVTAGSGQVTVGTGAACIYGIPYENDAALNVSIPTPVSNTRIDRIVLRANWSAQTARITRIAGTEGVGEPALTQVANTTWDIPLASVSITTGGVITVIDERTFAHFASMVRTENIDAGAVSGSKLAATVGASVKTPLNFVPLSSASLGPVAYTADNAPHTVSLAALVPSNAQVIDVIVQAQFSGTCPLVELGLYSWTGSGWFEVAVVRLDGSSGNSEPTLGARLVPEGGQTISYRVWFSGGTPTTAGLNIFVNGYYEPMNV